MQKSVIVWETVKLILCATSRMSLLFGHSKFGLSTAIGYTLQNCKIDTGFGTINGDANGIELTVGLDI